MIHLPWKPKLRERYEICALRRSLLDILNPKLNAGIQIMFQPFPVQTRRRVGIVCRRRSNKSDGKVVRATARRQTIGEGDAGDTKS